MKVAKEAISIFLVIAMATGLVLLVVSPGPLGHRPVDLNDRDAIQMLVEYAGAQSVLHASEGIAPHQYWREDISGIYSLDARSDNEPKLIERSLACADAAPKVSLTTNREPVPKAGYLYKALRFAEETTLRPNVFAACAYPCNRMVSRWMYIISHLGVVYRKECPTLSPPEKFPNDPRREGWEEVPSMTNR